MAHTRTPVLAITCALVLVLLWPRTSSAPHGAALPVVELPARWASGRAADVSTLIEANGTVFFGRVTALQGQRLERLGGERPPLPVSLYSVAVEQPLLGGLAAGDTVTLEQAGGIAAQSGGGQARIVLEGDEPFTVGAAYLFFARPAANATGHLVTAPFARLEVRGGDLVPLARWARLGALRQVSGLGRAGSAGVTAPASHPGEPQKKIWSDRWYQQVQGGDYDAWLTLTTSDVWLDCDDFGAACGDKWFEPFDNSLAEWNSVDTTAFFDLQPDLSEEYDVNVDISDSIPGAAGLLGLASFFDENYDYCEGCVFRYGWVDVGDDEHVDIYGKVEQRTGTILHEIGHILSLAHESVDEGEVNEYPCGEDDTGPIPHSVMSYNCIDPVETGGLAETFIHDWDVCGVNHAYFDPTIGLSGCGGGGIVLVAGNVDCDGDVDAIDGLKVSRYVANLAVSQGLGCPLIGSEAASLFGDVDCDGDVDAVDSLKILRRIANLSVTQNQPCPLIGDPL